MNCHVGEATEVLENKLCSFSKLSVTSPTSQLILQPLRRFTYVTAHSPTLPLLHLRRSSSSNSSVALPTSLLILQPFRCFTYVTAHSPSLLSLLQRHRLFTYVTWRAAHGPQILYVAELYNCGLFLQAFWTFHEWYRAWIVGKWCMQGKHWNAIMTLSWFVPFGGQSKCMLEQNYIITG